MDSWPRHREGPDLREPWRNLGKSNPELQTGSPVEGSLAPSGSRWSYLNRRNRPKAVVIIVNYKSFDNTAECLVSVLNSEYDNLEVLVVDNNSSDESAKRLKERFPQVCVLESTE